MARFTLPARLVVIWWPTVSQPANLAAPTVANISAGTNLIGNGQGEGLANINGFMVQPSTIPVPDYASRTVGTVPGDVTIPDSSLDFWMDDTTRTLYNALTVGATGVFGFFFDGTATTKESRLFPTTIISKDRNYARDEAHMFSIGVSLSTPSIGAVV